MQMCLLIKFVDSNILIDLSTLNIKEWFLFSDQ